MRTRIGFGGLYYERRVSTHPSRRRELKMRRMWILSTGITLLAGILPGQVAHPAPIFEVASLKPAPPFSLEKMQSGQLHVASIAGSQASFQIESLRDLLVYAFRVKPYQISGPSWIRDGRWDIVAKLPEGTSQDRVPEVVQSLLIERFDLATHHESRENPAYDLIVDKVGPKLRPSSPEDEFTSSKDGASTSTRSSIGRFSWRWRQYALRQ